MLLLAMDTATPAISAALAEVDDSGVRVLTQRVTVDGRAHAELLAPQVEAVLAEAGVKPRDLAAVVAGVGPGPYTGLRVGLMTAETISSALRIPAYGVCTLDGLGAATRANQGEVLVATDARRKEVYWALYHDGVRTGLGPNVNRPAEIAPILAERGVLLGVGEGASRYADLLGVASAEPHYPSMEQLAALAAERVLNGAASERLTPLYLRRPDAVEPSGPKSALATGER